MYLELLPSSPVNLKLTASGAGPDVGEAEKVSLPHPQRRANAARVWGPTMPTWVRPSSAWNAATALAALPAPDAGNVAYGTIAIENNAGDWTANTDDLTDASDVTTAAFNDSTEGTIASPKMWELVSESDGDIDINITEAGAATWYLILVNPTGTLVPSAAITFT